MLRLKPIILILIVSGLLLIRIVAQVTTHRGNLLVIDMYSSEINSADTVGNWEKNVYSTGTADSHYIGVICNNSKHYFLFSNINYGFDFGLNNSTNNYLQVFQDDVYKHILHYNQWFDVPEPYLHFIPYIKKVENGFWILFGNLGNTFVRNDDSLFITPNYSESDLMHIAGRIQGDELIVFRQKESYYHINKYYLADLSSSPQIENMRPIIVEPDQSNNYMFSITKFSHLGNNAYAFLSADGRLWIAEYEGDGIKHKLNLVISHEWFNVDNAQLIGNNLFKSGSGKIYSQQINPTDYSISEDEIFVDKVNFAHDNGFKSNFFSFIRNDSLLIYSLKEKIFVNSFDLSAINYSGNVIVDSPYVYVHQTLTVTDVKDEFLKNEFSLEQNYPNPFNPTTTIKFTLPNVGDEYIHPLQTKLIVYDILGREIITLVNEVKSAGTYEVEFYAIDLPNGVYLYRLQFGNKSQTKKFVLLR
ncbi:hypothetical protein ASZ90_003238 [hydrocarbon metagenome]|uniref:Secretion system C-terminal sorting domain-containing protein n=1 Tax=hydrocarbon metagenome TaxID=938273 RepID=A0A0W8G332_9ZZZZ